MAKRGRKSTYTPELHREICDRLSTGETLTSICSDSHMPETRTVGLWKEANANFASDFARARDAGFDAIADECIRIANTPLEGVRTEISDDGKTKEVRDDMLGHRKLQIETRLKLLAKWDPRRYGDRIHTEFSGEIGVKKSAADMTDEELAAIAARKQDKPSAKAQKTPAKTAKPRTKSASKP